VTATAATNLGLSPQPPQILAKSPSSKKITTRLGTQISQFQNNTKDYKNTILGEHNQVHATQFSVFSKTKSECREQSCSTSKLQYMTYQLQKGDLKGINKSFLYSGGHQKPVTGEWRVVPITKLGKK